MAQQPKPEPEPPRPQLSAVEIPRGSRCADAAGIHAGDMTFLCWNVLADCYLEGYAERQLTRQYSSATLDWPTRCARLLAEIVAADADVVCVSPQPYLHPQPPIPHGVAYRPMLTCRAGICRCACRK